MDARRPPSESELRLLEQVRRRLRAECTNLVTAVGRGGKGTGALVERLDEVDAEAGAAEVRETTRPLTARKMVSLDSCAVEWREQRRRLCGVAVRKRA